MAELSDVARCPLGTTGMDVTPVGFDAWAIGGARSPAQVDGWLAAAAVYELSKDGED